MLSRRPPRSARSDPTAISPLTHACDSTATEESPRMRRESCAVTCHHPLPFMPPSRSASELDVSAGSQPDQRGAQHECCAGAHAHCGCNDCESRSETYAVHPFSGNAREVSPQTE